MLAHGAIVVNLARQVLQHGEYVFLQAHQLAMLAVIVAFIQVVN